MSEPSVVNIHPPLEAISDLLAQVNAHPPLDGVRLVLAKLAEQTQAPDAALYLAQSLTSALLPDGTHPADERWVSALVGWADGAANGIHPTDGLVFAKPDTPAQAAVLRDSGALVGVLLFTPTPETLHTPLTGLLVNLLALSAAKLRAEDARARYIQNQDQFVTDFLHDLRTPMTVVKSTADIIEGGLTRDGDTRYSKMLKRIMANIDAISELLEHVFVAGVYDPDTGKYTLTREAVDLETIISVILKNLTAAAQKKGLLLKADVARELPILSADKTMLTRALNNLIDNAVKYTNEGEVEVRVQRQGDSILISVRDTGVGLSEEAKRRVFDKFFRNNNKAHGSVKGTGLGLFIVHSAAVHHGGRVWVQSEPDKGSTFSLQLPLKPADLP